MLLEVYVELQSLCLFLCNHGARTWVVRSVRVLLPELVAQFLLVLSLGRSCGLDSECSRAYLSRVVSLPLLAVRVGVLTRREVNQRDELEDFKSHLLTLIVINHIRLKQLAIHMEELEQEVFVESKCDLASAHLVDHHERYPILFLLVAVVNKVHVDDVILDDYVFTVGIELGNVPCGAGPDLNGILAFRSVFVVIKTLFLLVLQAEAQYNIEDTRAKIEVAQAADQLLELCLVTYLQAVGPHRRKRLELLAQLPNCLKAEIQRSESIDSILDSGSPV